MLCSICPRRCNAIRTDRSGLGKCRSGLLPVASRAARHMWEEPCISGTRGSGAIFFSSCALGCRFCQNSRISRGGEGRAFTPDELARLFARVEALGVHNINLVTPSHVAPAVLDALKIYKPEVPVVWNSGGYETTDMIEKARGLVDVFLPDLKFYSPKISSLLADAPDYFEIAIRAVKAMAALSGPPVYDAGGLMLSGTIVRHLVLPRLTGESLKILDAIARELPKGTPVSLMRQYTPQPGTGIPGLDRRLTGREYERAADHMASLGLSGYLQSAQSADAAFTPDFADEESRALFPDAEP